MKERHSLFSLSYIIFLSLIHFLALFPALCPFCLSLTFLLSLYRYLSRLLSFSLLLSFLFNLLFQALAATFSFSLSLKFSRSPSFSINLSQFFHNDGKYLYQLSSISPPHAIISHKLQHSSLSTLSLSARSQPKLSPSPLDTVTGIINPPPHPLPSPPPSHALLPGSQCHQALGSSTE